MGSHLLLAIPRLIRALFWIMIPWGNFWANKWPILMGLGLIMTQICAYKVSFSSLISISRQLSLCSRDSFHFCMKQRLFPRVRPNDPFTFNTSVALTTTNTKEAKAAYFFIKKKITYTKSENYGQQHQTIDGCQIGVSFERNVIANAFKNGPTI